MSAPYTTFLSKKKYADFYNWNEFFPNNKTDLSKIKFHSSWNPIFNKLFNDDKMKRINDCLDKELKNNDLIMHPAPELLFNAFILTPFDKIKVVFIGQDPYFDHDKYNDKIVHQAMGLSFSVPYDIKIPSSLNNIYSNLLKNGHIKKIPPHGNLEFWALQGCLMLNTSLTVLNGSDNKNCHQNIWRWFTDAIIKYISDNKENVIFVLWGNNAYEKYILIDLDKHETIITSHPSGLSADKPMKSFPSFNSYDHFGEINNILKKWKMTPIVWQI